MKKLTGCLLLAVFASACAQSKNYKTTDLTGTFTVSADKQGNVICTAHLFENTQGYPNPIVLSDGDAVYCDGQILQSSGNDDPNYTVSVTYHPTSAYQFEFNRSGTAYTYTASLPDPVQISSPAANTVLKTGTAPTFTWTASTATNISMLGAFEPTSTTDKEVEACAFSSTNSDPGKATCTALPAVAGSTPLSETWIISRMLSGTGPSTFKGTFTAITTDSVTVEISN